MISPPPVMSSRSEKLNTPGSTANGLTTSTRPRTRSDDQKASSITMLATTTRYATRCIDDASRVTSASIGAVAMNAVEHRATADGDLAHDRHGERQRVDLPEDAAEREQDPEVDVQQHRRPLRAVEQRRERRHREDDDESTKAEPVSRDSRCTDRRQR